MTNQHRYDPFAAELRRFADRLDVKQFRSIGTGIGFNTKNPSSDAQALWSAHSPGFAFQGQSAIGSLPRRVESTSIQVSKDRSTLQAIINESHNLEQKKKKILFQTQIVAVFWGFSRFFSRVFWGFFTLARWGALHVADLMIVTSALVLALLMASVFFAPRSGGGDFWSSFQAWTPVVLLLNLKLTHVLLVIYSVFLLYALIFKIAFGRTISRLVFVPKVKIASQKVE